MFPQPTELSTGHPGLTPKCAQVFPKEERQVAVAETQCIHISTAPYYDF